MKFSEYLKRLEEYKFDKFESTIIISYNNRCHVYRGESDFNNKFVVADNFIHLDEYILNVGIQVLLSDEPRENSENVALEILQLRYEQELERKRKDRQELKEYRERCRKQEKLENLWLSIVFITLIISGGGIWLASKMGWL